MLVLRVAVGVRERFAVPVGETLAVVKCDADVVSLQDSLSDSDSDGVGEELSLGEVDVVTAPELAVELVDGEVDSDAAAVDVCDNIAVEVPEMDGEADSDTDTAAVTVDDRDGAAVELVDGEVDGDAAAVDVCDGTAVELVDGEVDGDAAAVDVGDDIAVEVPEIDGEEDSDTDLAAVDVDDGTAVEVGDGEVDSDATAVDVGDEIAVTVSDTVRDDDVAAVDVDDGRALIVREMEVADVAVIDGAAAVILEVVVVETVVFDDSVLDKVREAARDVLDDGETSTGKRRGGGAALVADAPRAELDPIVTAGLAATVNTSSTSKAVAASDSWSMCTPSATATPSELVSSSYASAWPCIVIATTLMPL